MGHNFSQTETLSEYIENDDLVSFLEKTGKKKNIIIQFK